MTKQLVFNTPKEKQAFLKKGRRAAMRSFRWITRNLPGKVNKFAKPLSAEDKRILKELRADPVLELEMLRSKD